MQRNIWEEEQEDYVKYLEEALKGKTPEEAREFLYKEAVAVLEELKQSGVYPYSAGKAGFEVYGVEFLQGKEKKVSVKKVATYKVKGIFDYSTPAAQTAIKAAKKHFSVLFPEYIPIGSHFDRLVLAIHDGIVSSEVVIRDQLFEKVTDVIAEGLSYIFPDDETE